MQLGKRNGHEVGGAMKDCNLQGPTGVHFRLSLSLGDDLGDL